MQVFRKGEELHPLQLTEYSFPSHWEIITRENRGGRPEDDTADNYMDVQPTCHQNRIQHDHQGGRHDSSLTTYGLGL